MTTITNAPGSAVVVSDSVGQKIFGLFLQLLAWFAFGAFFAFGWIFANWLTAKF